MGMMMLVWLIIVIVIALVVVRLVVPQLPAASTDQERLLAQQAEQIEQLQDELRRVQEQADFTERLLTERTDVPPADAAAEEQRD